MRVSIPILVSLQELVITVNGLRKEYEDKGACSIFKNKKKVAVKNLSFCVKKGLSTLLCFPTNSDLMRRSVGDLAFVRISLCTANPMRAALQDWNWMILNMSLPTQGIL